MGRRRKGEGNIRFDERHQRWLASFKPPHGPRHYVTGRKGELLKDFKKRLDKARNAAESGVPPHRETFAAYLTDVWLPRVKREVQPRTYESYSSTVATHVVPVVASIRLTDIQPHDIERCMIHAASAGCAARTVNYVRTVARIALNAAVKARIIDRNAASLAAPMKTTDSDTFVVDPYNEMEIASLASAAEKYFNGLLVSISAFLGLRRGEVLGLRWEDFDEEQAMLSVERQVVREEKALRVKQLKTKGSRRILRLPPFLVQRLLLHRRTQLEARMKAGDRWRNERHIFASRWGGPLDPRNVQRLYDQIVAKAGVQRRRFHALRHTAATLQLQRGTLDITVSKMLGHSSTRITKDVYAHVTPPMMESAVSAMEQMYESGEAKRIAAAQGATSSG